jgi:hypothetical protein
VSKPDRQHVNGKCTGEFLGLELSEKADNAHQSVSFLCRLALMSTQNCVIVCVHPYLTSSLAASLL